MSLEDILHSVDKLATNDMVGRRLVALMWRREQRDCYSSLKKMLVTMRGLRSMLRQGRLEGLNHDERESLTMVYQANQQDIVAVNARLAALRPLIHHYHVPVLT